MLRKLTALRPLSSDCPSLSISPSPIKYCADITLFDQKEKKHLPLVRLTSNFTHQRPVSLKEMIEKVAYRKSDSECEPQQHSSLLHFNSLLSLDALKFPEELLEEQRRRNQEFDEKLTSASSETSSSSSMVYFTANNNSEEQEANFEQEQATWIQILPLHFSEKVHLSGARPKSIFSEVHYPVEFTFKSQVKVPGEDVFKMTTNKVFGYPVNVAGRCTTSNAVFVGGRNSLLHCLSLPHLNVPLFFFPAPPPPYRSAGGNQQQHNNNKSPHQMVMNNAANNLLHHLNRHLRKVASGCDRIMNNFYTPEMLSRYSGESKLVVVDNHFSIPSSSSSSSSSSCVILEDGPEALRQTNLVCSALHEATNFIREESEPLIASLNAIRQQQKEETIKQRNAPSKKAATAISARIEELENEKQKIRQALEENTKTVWQHCFCKVLDSHLKERGCIVSLVEILSMSRDQAELNKFLNSKRFSSSVQQQQTRDELVKKELESEMKIFVELIESWVQ